MRHEEDSVIDGIGKSPLPRPVSGADGAGGRIAVPRMTANAGAVQAPATSSLGRIARDLAALPPVDAARVETLRQAIASGAYRIDPDRIAERMIALETPSPKG